MEKLQRLNNGTTAMEKEPRLRKGWKFLMTTATGTIYRRKARNSSPTWFGNPKGGVKFPDAHRGEEFLYVSKQD